MLGQELIFEQLRKIIKQSPADQTEAVFSGSTVGTTRLVNSAIAESRSKESSEVYLRVVIGKQIGVVACDEFEENTLTSALKEALTVAKLHKEHPRPVVLPGAQSYPTLNIYSTETASYPQKQCDQQVATLLQKTKQSHLALSGFFSTAQGEIAVLNSNGLSAYQPFTSASTTLTLGQDGHVGTVNDLARDVGQINLAALWNQAYERAQIPDKTRTIEPGNYTVVFEPRAVAHLLEWVNYIGFRSAAYQEKISFLSERLGKTVFGENISIYDDAGDTSSLAFPFDFEGIPKRKTPLIERGVAKSIVYDTTSAAQDGVKTTGHAIVTNVAYNGAMAVNLFLEPGKISKSELLRSVEQGLIIRRFYSLNGLLDPRNALVLGTTREGCLWLEKGKVRANVPDVRINASLFDIFSNVVALSRETERVPYWWDGIGCITVPTIVVKNFPIAGLAKS